MEGYDFTKDDLAQLILRRFYPERTQRESAVLRDYLLAHGAEYDRFSFSVRVGFGQVLSPNLLPGIRRSTNFSSRKRMDMLGWQGNSPTIVEVKERVTAAALGQILTYQQLFLEELPDAPPPRLVIIGRYSDQDTLRSLASYGIDVYLYDPAVAAGGADGGRV